MLSVFNIHKLLVYLKKIRILGQPMQIYVVHLCNIYIKHQVFAESNLLLRILCYLNFSTTIHSRLMCPHHLSCNGQLNLRMNPRVRLAVTAEAAAFLAVVMASGGWCFVSDNGQDNWPR